jgi:hypothetical protein
MASPVFSILSVVMINDIPLWVHVEGGIFVVASYSNMAA